MAPSCVMPFGTGRFVHNYSTPLCGVARSELRSEEHTSELQSQSNLVCRLLLEKKKELNCGERCHHSTNIARIDGHLVAKTTTSIRRDNADTLLRQASDNSKERTMCVRGFRSHPHSQFTGRFIVISNAATRLDRSRVDTRNKHILLDNDATCFRFGEIRIGFSPLACLPMVNLVCGLFIFLIRSQQGGIRIKSLFWINDHW